MFKRAKLVYTIVIQTTIIYSIPIWFSLVRIETIKANLIAKLKQTQNQCLCTIARVYKATPILLLKSETRVLLIRTYFLVLQAQYQACTKDLLVQALLKKACKRI